MRDRILEIKFNGFSEFCYFRSGVAQYINDVLKNLPNSQSILLEVAVNEAVNNALKHGTGLLSDKLTSLKLFVSNDRQLIVKVKDCGDGFPGNKILADLPIKQCYINAEALKENGRGLMLMKSATDGLCYNNKGNEVTLIKNLKH